MASILIPSCNRLLVSFSMFQLASFSTKKLTLSLGNTHTQNKAQTIHGMGISVREIHEEDNIALLGDEAINSDAHDNERLNELGYKQELSRNLSAIANFSVTFSIISVLTGITTLYTNGLTYGGPMTMIWGWPIVGGLTMMVGLSMAEICSAYPTSGGLYFWSAKLCGNRWGPLACWLTGWYALYSLDYDYIIGKRSTQYF